MEKINTKPELNIKTRVVGPAMPGSFVVVDGKFMPNTKDKATKERVDNAKKLDKVQQ